MATLESCTVADIFNFEVHQVTTTQLAIGHEFYLQAQDGFECPKYL